MSSIRGAWVLLLFAAAAPAQETEMPWMLALSAQRDENAYAHRVGSFHLGLSDASWFSVAMGASNAPSAEADVSARLLAVDIEHGFDSIGLAAGIESWGDEDNLETRDVRGEVFFSSEQFRLALIAERRDIDIFFSADGAPRISDLRRVGVSAEGVGFSGHVQVASAWQVHGSWMRYDYPRRIQVVPRAARLNLLTASTLTLAYSFVDRYTTLGFERTFDQVVLNVDVSRDRSTIDRSELGSLRASVLFPVARRIDLEFVVGSSKPEQASSTLFGGLSVLIYGGG